VLVGVVGGNLQGVEATYLARKAGWEVIVVDRKPVVPAAGLCDSYIPLDVTAEKDLGAVLGRVDLIIPALENDKALACLEQWARDKSMPFAFDSAAYFITSSKLRSYQLFTDLGLSIPSLWPECGFPVIAKPATGSGSHGVSVFYDSNSLQNHIQKSHREWILQEYIPGPSYSIEVMGLPGRHVPLQVTDLEMDADYDCKRVIAPTGLTQSLIADFENIAVTLAGSLDLKGLMDVEVILQDDRLKVLEIDARLPSQTPTAVFRSTGFNMIEVLAELFLNPPSKFDPRLKPAKGVVYEHIKVSSNVLEVAGENIMTVTDALFLHQDFFGADEAITNYRAGRDTWVATLIISDDTLETARQKRYHVIEEIRQHFNLSVYRDPEPIVDIKGRQP
jgi:pyrrolysine biosynthesis protein PylC